MKLRQTGDYLASQAPDGRQQIGVNVALDVHKGCTRSVDFDIRSQSGNERCDRNPTDHLVGEKQMTVYLLLSRRAMAFLIKQRRDFVEGVLTEVIGGQHLWVYCQLLPLCGAWRDKKCTCDGAHRGKVDRAELSVQWRSVFN